MLNWNTIDTVLLDMDGTLIDQRFDNHFFHDMIPAIIAERDNIDIETVRKRSLDLYEQYAGKIEFYCLDFWNKTLNLDLHTLKHDIPETVTIREGVEEFLQAVQALQKNIVLVTNAHPYSMNFKLDRVPLRQYFNRILSVHELGMPKENANFWPALQATEPFDPETTLFIDDNLPMLDAAKDYNIKHLFAIAKPDSALPEKDTGDYYGLHHFSEITPAKVA